MSHVYRVIEVVGSSTRGVDDAIAKAVARAGETTRHLEWFEMVNVRGHIDDGSVAHTQVTLKIGFRIESSDELSD
ncbi:MAG: dodecin domain-containing protein [Rhodococcus sp.]|uniref:dodecin n=1 Tax=Rhodococcus TaxID=1827 RepID=UPI00168EC838|nr:MULTISPECIES: dodecin [Rhodococcus]NLV78985.1 dodecin domain-containing protein [Rhodococcus sp. (in: high G+C Gram-positive bacteria)]